MTGRIALLGDAAHAMTPDLGQGAGQAFEDAAAPATCRGPGQPRWPSGCCVTTRSAAR
ncbi:FAD-dependent monooxygenase [Nonomuraea terrae]|uniref:FAD-dependent monooxygenase n=1 Tax=Nonomuraea terrae TaxID=2530383 RepID=UPI0037AEDC54